LRDLSLYTVLIFAIMMTVSAWSSVEDGYEYEFRAHAQIAVERQQDQQQSISSLTTPSTTGPLPSIEITSHSSGQQVEVGPLTISGTSSDTSSTDCEVYADWNDSKPFGKAVAVGPGGPDDYSKWTFTYGNGYHLIKNGTNNLTSKISCMEPTNSTKWSSINLIGVYGLNSTGGLDSEPTINQAITTGLPPPSPSPIGLPLPTLNQPGVTSSSLDPVVGEANEEDEESNEDDDDSDDSNVENEDDSNEEDEEDNNGSGGEDSGDDENGGSSTDDDEDNDLIDFGPDGPVDFDIDDFMD
jgi:hypothetical protein